MVRSRPNGEVDPLRMGVLLTGGAVDWRTHHLHLTIWPCRAAAEQRSPFEWQAAFLIVEAVSQSLMRKRTRGDVGRKKLGEGVGQWRRTQENVNGPNSEELGPVAEDRGFEPLRDVTPARVPGV